MANELLLLKKYLIDAYEIFSKIPVTGDQVELMAAGRADLRSAYQLTETLVQNNKHDMAKEKSDG